MTPSRTVVAGLVVVCFASALAAVYTVHESRAAFADLQAAFAERDAMNVEWGRLQIEEAAWSTHARIERIATSRLQMRLPRPDEVVILER